MKYQIVAVCISYALLMMCRVDIADAQRKAFVRAYGVDEQNVASNSVKIIRELRIRKTHLPLLTYVFFEKDRAEIPSRYNQIDEGAARIFSVTQFSDGSYQNRPPLAAYYELLNIVGRRLLENRREKITLIGCKTEREAPELALQRASAIKKYLVNTFRIEPDRIEARVSSARNGMPEKPTSNLPASQKELENEENRRVEIVGSWIVTQPIIVVDTTARVSPPDIAFELKHRAQKVYSADLNSWQVESDTLYHESILDWKDSVRTKIWHIEEDRDHQPTTSSPLYYSITVEQEDSRKYESELRSIEVEQRSLETDISGSVAEGKEILKYNLILFDFSKDTLLDIHKSILDLIRPAHEVKFNSTIRISGFADNSGDSVNSLKLSQRRSDRVQKYLAQKLEQMIKQDQMVSIGKGVKDLNRDHWETPESRMYCRTVEIIIERKRDL